MGLLTPLGTLIASGLLSIFRRTGADEWLPWAGGGLGVVYLLSALGLSRSASGPPRGEADNTGQVRKVSPAGAESPGKSDRSREVV